MDSTRLSNLTDLIRYKGAAPTPPPPHSRMDAPPEPPPLSAPEVDPSQSEPEAVQKALPPEPEQPAAVPVPAEKARLVGKDLYLEAQVYLQEVREKLRRRESFTLDKPAGIIKRMISNPALVDEMYLLSLDPKQDSAADVASPVNSMVYCFKIGVRRKYVPDELIEICLAALLHDIGMWLLPDGILKKAGKLTPEELEKIRKHTEIARDILMRFDPVYPSVSRAVYEHHERENGQGYPRGIKGNEICEFAKIIGICDSYEAMTHDRVHKKAIEQHLSVLSLASSKDMLFAPAIIKAFLDEITLYPTGSYVRLNSKAIGIVVQTNPQNPFKPVIRLIADGQGNHLRDGNTVDLSEDNILNIVAGVAADDVPA